MRITTAIVICAILVLLGASCVNPYPYTHLELDSATSKVSSEMDYVPNELDISQSELSESYASDREKANQMYNGKVIKITGAIDKVDLGNTADAGYVVFEQYKGNHEVRCYLSLDYHRFLVGKSDPYITRGIPHIFFGLVSEELDRFRNIVEVIGCVPVGMILR